jgi:hypothetical protein
MLHGGPNLVGGTTEMTMRLQFGGVAPTQHFGEKAPATEYKSTSQVGSANNFLRPAIAPAVIAMVTVDRSSPAGERDNQQAPDSRADCDRFVHV